jgi:branched-chain amino acid transport system permease protein
MATTWKVASRRPRSVPEVMRNAFLTTFITFLIVYPILDQQFGLRAMGSMNPILVYTMLALGLNIVVGFAGLLDLGYAAFFAIGGYTAAFLTSPSSPLPFRTDFWVALLASWFVAALFGIILGAPTLHLRGDYLAIVTLAFGEIVPRAFLNLEQWTRGSKGINPIGRPVFPWVEVTPNGPQLVRKELFATDQIFWYYLIFLVAVLSVFAIRRLRDSRLGRAWMAMREDEIAAASMGINLVQTKLLAFALGASFSGFAGSLFASMLQFIDPFQFQFDISIMVLAMVILGGLGNVWGVIFGGVVMGAFNLVLTERATQWVHALGETIGLPLLQQAELANWKFMIYGLALVLLMQLRPEGIFPSRERQAELHEADEDGEREGQVPGEEEATPERPLETRA